MKISGHGIGDNHPPYIVAEMSANHNGDLKTAIKIIEAAADSGADAIKFQLYTAESLAEARGGANKMLSNGIWGGMTLGKLYEQAETPAEWWPEMVAACDDLGLLWFSSVFDVHGVDFLEHHDCPVYKISSFDLANKELIRKAARTGKPIIISTGMALDLEIGQAVMACKESGNTDLALLHCVSAYPTPAKDANLSRIYDLRRMFGVPVGFSDHTIGSAVSIAAVAMGAAIIEKHLTVTPGVGVDGEFSADPDTFAEMSFGVSEAYDACQERDVDKTYRDLRVLS